MSLLRPTGENRERQSKQSAPKVPAHWPDTRPSKDISTPATKQELIKTRQDLLEQIKKVQQGQNQGQGYSGGMFGKVVRNLGKGINNIGRSMSTPDNEHARPRIAQLPTGSTGRPTIATSANLDRIRDPKLRGQRIGGPDWRGRNPQ